MRDPAQIVIPLLALMPFSVGKLKCTKPNERWITSNTCGGYACTERGICGRESFKPGCTCDDDFKRDEAGNCIPEKDCPPIDCPRFAEVASDDSCATSCQGNCDWPNGEVVCSRICNRGCICIRGYVRDASFNCVRVDKCPQAKCNPNEHYSVCNGSCEATCQDEYRYWPQAYCKTSCDHGCVCNTGYVRGPTGRCIKPDDCPGPDAGNCTTSNDEKYSECEAHCQPTCEMKTGVFPCNLCRPGCVCKNGYVRDQQDKCIKLEDCPTPTGGGKYVIGDTVQKFGFLILMGIGVMRIWIDDIFASL